MTSPVQSTTVVTGASDGIGLETAYQLARLGHRVIVHARTAAKARAVVETLKARAPDATFVPVHGDFSRLSEVRALAGQIAEVAPQLDVLLNNAGAFFTERTESEDGFEATFQVNHLAPFLLTVLLLPQLRAATAARVVNVSSMAHSRGRVDLDDLDSKRAYDGYSAYSLSKLLNVHFTHELARRLTGTHITTNALHPGVITTKLLRTGFGMGGGSLESGARTSVYCATAPELAHVTGRYFSDAREARSAPHATDEKLEAKLWAISEQRAGLK
jgi:NAD(P)-dependent dehydrogenase (short-subunit alcohol dehydrogenase family)